MVDRFHFYESKREQDEGIDRGQMLVRTENEWRQRHRSMLKEELKWAVLVGFLIVLLFWCVFLIFELIMTGTVSWSTTWPMGIWALIIVGLLLLVHFMRNGQYDAGPALGLYERGVQATLEIFVPYDEIEEVRRMTQGSLGGKREVVRVKAKVTWKSPSLYRSSWLMMMDFLGEDGAKELEMRVHAPGSPE